ncbi:MAG: hypothetical protein QNJ74_09555 [Trichodesmium sp. MO_231.B1]|nr:hypothetical protein [Trichodesmium sp. MO_231.B1]
MNCETTQDTDHNAAINILLAGGQSERLNGRGDKRKTSIKVAAANERSTHFEPIQLSLFDLDNY